MVRIGATVVVVLLIADTAFCFLNTSHDNNGLVARHRRRRKKYKSTSSSSGQKKSDSDDYKESIDLSSMDTTSSEDKKYPKPKSSLERRGWRKWHRKCTKCPEDMRKTWRDLSIKWICGQYQRARRSFKSLCMMYYRNCQDGTMFVKIRDRRCPNTTSADDPRRGDHFFYDYKAKLFDESTDTSSETSESSELTSRLFD